MTEVAQAPADPARNYIELENIRHVYKGGTVALDGINLSFGTGLFGLLGPNGAGKSTLMRILCSLIVPTAGKARVAGHDVLEQRSEVRNLIGYLPQEFGAWRLHKVGEVLDTLALLSGIRNKAERKERVAKVLAQVGLEKVATRKVKKLSGGMVRRLGVAQALVHGPRVLIVDEPTVGLDPQERLRFRKLMAELSKDHTILLSTHIVADLGSGCREIALIESGKLIFHGDPVDLVEQAKGKVFEVTRGPGATHDDRFEVVSTVREASGTRLRAVSGDGSIPEGATLVDDPTLEEAYLAFMASKGIKAVLESEED